MSDLEKNKLVEGGVYSVDFSDYSFSSEISQKKKSVIHIRSIKEDSFIFVFIITNNNQLNPNFKRLQAKSKNLKMRYLGINTKTNSNIKTYPLIQQEIINNYPEILI